MSSTTVRRGRSKRLIHKEAAPLFAGVKAWFSSSVSQDKKVAWIRHGGSCGNWKEAQLLFSENQKARDTAELFEQMEFLWGYVTVFHASFISSCIKERNMKQVAMASFLILPPEFPLVRIEGIPSGSCHTTDIADIPSGSRHTTGIEDIPSGSRHTTGIKDVPSGSHHTTGIKDIPSGSRHTTGIRDIPSGSRHTTGIRDVPSDSHHTTGIRDVPSSSHHTTDLPIESDKVRDEEPVIPCPNRLKRHLAFSQQSRTQSVSIDARKMKSTTYSMNRTNDPCRSCKKSFHFCNGVEENRIEYDTPLLDLESIPHVRTLKHTSLQLFDFVPCRNGCSAIRKL